MDINLTSPNGVKLKTAGKYCSQDISVIPQLESVELTPSKGQQTVTPDSGYSGFGQVKVAAIPDDYIIPSGTQQITKNGTYDVTNKANVAVNIPSEKPTLYAPTISLSGSIITITPSTKNGSFVTGYKVYANNELIDEILATVNYDLSQHLTTSGDYVITFKAKGANFNDSAASNAVSYTVAPSGYSVAISGWNGYGLSIYDGTSDSGTLLAHVSYGSDEPTTVICQSGNLFLQGASATYRFGDTTVVTGGVTIISEDDNSYNGTFKVTGDGTITLDIYCLIEGTQITLADGTKKAIEDITYDDELLVWNFYEGKFDTAKPSWIKIEEVAPKYNLVKFSNGTEVGFVGMGGEKGYHRIFNKEKGKFTYTGNFDETPNGTTTFAEDNSFPTVVSQEIVEKEVKFYNVSTEKHYNLFANGILTSCRLSNMYRIENMKYVGERLITDEQVKAYFERIEQLRKHA